MRSRGTHSRSLSRATAAINIAQEVLLAEAGDDEAVAISDCGGFGKGRGCPSSEELLQFCRDSARAVSSSSNEISSHLANCDFCDAEKHLLLAHPPREPRTGSCTPAQIPVHLYALARALLTRPHPLPGFIETVHAAAK